MKKIIILSIAVLLALTACEKKLDIDIPDGGEHIVVNGIINSDSLIYVEISKSQGVLDNNDIPLLTDATVKLYRNDIFIENLTHIDSGVYVSTLIPEIGFNYKIELDYDNLKSVNADMILKKSVEIISVDTTFKINTYDYGGGEIYQDYEMQYNIKIDDNGNTRDYYFLAISLTQPMYEYDEYGLPVFAGYQEIHQWFDTYDAVFKDYNYEYDLDGMLGGVFTDELFNGKQIIIDVTTYFYFDDYYDKLDVEDSFIKVKLLTVNEDIYRYITSYNLNQQTQYDPFAQPVQIFTNIENGLGLFSGYTMDVDTIVVDFGF